MRNAPEDDANFISLTLAHHHSESLPSPPLFFFCFVPGNVYDLIDP